MHLFISSAAGCDYGYEIQNYSVSEDNDSSSVTCRYNEAL